MRVELFAFEKGHLRVLGSILDGVSEIAQKFRRKLWVLTNKGVAVHFESILGPQGRF